MFLPSGTTSNEALHHEVNAWFRETPRMHQVRRPSGAQDAKPLRFRCPWCDFVVVSFC
jgi:hypothetical protein